MLAYIRNLVEHKKQQDAGASAVEYGLLIAAIAAVIVLVVFLLGGVVRKTFDKTCGAINSSNGTGSNCQSP